MSHKTLHFHNAAITHLAFQQELTQRVQFTADVIRNTLQKLTIPQPFWYDWSWAYGRQYSDFRLVRFKEDYRDEPVYQDVNEDLLSSGVITDDIHLSFLTKPQQTSVLHEQGKVCYYRYIIPLKYFLNDPVTVAQLIRSLARDNAPHQHKADLLAKRQQLTELKQKQQKEISAVEEELQNLVNKQFVKPRTKDVKNLRKEEKHNFMLE